MEFKRGDIVRHSSEFLRNIAWYTNVPINGRVMWINEVNQLVHVEWCTDEIGDSPQGILSCNLEQCPRVRREVT